MSKIERLVENISHQVGDLSSIENITRGIGNENYKVTFTPRNGTDRKTLVITVFRNPEYRWKARKELLIRQLLLEKGSQIPIPPLFSVSEDFAPDGFPPYVIRDYVGELDLDEALEVSSTNISRNAGVHLARQLGDIFGEIHDVTLSAFGRLENVIDASQSKFPKDGKVFESWETFFTSLVEEQLNVIDQLPDGKAIGSFSAYQLKQLTPKVYEYLEEKRDILSTVNESRLCHHDTRFGNIIVQRNKEGMWEIAAVIDFEWALAGDPEIDLAYMENWLHFAPYRKSIRQQIAAFLSGYESHRQISREYPQKRTIYHIYRSLSYLYAVFSRDIGDFLSHNPRGINYVSTHRRFLENVLSGKYEIPCAYTRWEVKRPIDPKKRINLEPVNRLLAKHQMHQEKYLTKIGDLELVIHPDVFNPTYTNTSLFFADNIDISRGTRVLDIFSGSGYQAIRAAKIAHSVVAIDISPKAVACIEENIRRFNLEEKVTVLRGDLFSPLKDGDRFDVIIANPPLLPGIPRNLLEVAVLDPDLEATKRFLIQLGKHLSPNGQAFLLFSNSGEKMDLGEEFVRKICERNNLNREIIATKPVGYETYFVIKITHKKR